MAVYVQNLQLNLSPFDFPFQKTINATLAANSSLSVLASAVQIFLDFNGLPCHDSVPHYKAVDPYLYLRCNYLPHIDGYTRASSIFGPTLPDYTQRNILDPWCRASFNISAVNGGTDFIRQLGLDDETLRTTKRIFMSYGLLDPVSSTGPREGFNLAGGDVDENKIYWIQGAAHAAEFIKEDVKDSEGLREVRRAEIETIKMWLSGHES